MKIGLLLSYGSSMDVIKQRRKPPWIATPLPKGGGYRFLERKLKASGIYTVCQEAKCPNIGECWSQKTATMMILGDTCTRACRFCHVKTGNPGGVVNKDEIIGASRMVEVMGLRYIVITSVDRDDLEDYGASHFAAVVRNIADHHPKTKIEVLIPDFNCVEQHMHTLAQSSPFVIAQNLETVKRLTHPVRDRRAGHEKTLKALKFYTKHYPYIPRKSSLMVGLGETEDELIEAFEELLNAGVTILTIGQYLRPSSRHLKIDRYYRPEEFHHLRDVALNLGFSFVASGPMVRSSYRAAEYLDFLETRREFV